MSSNEPVTILLPGYTLPLDYQPSATGNRRITTLSPLFPNALDAKDIEDGAVGRLDTQRELTMMRVMNSIAEKPEWDRKVFDETITSKWRKEISESGQDVSAKMMDWIIDEMKWKAGILKEKGFYTVFDAGVTRSDTAISPELQKALRDAVAPLENIPAEKKDYHPGSDQKVVDLVHPSLFPVVYGRTYILPDRVMTLDDCLASIGGGEMLQYPDAVFGHQPRFGNKWKEYGWEPWSRNFQWLPCDVEFTDNDDGCRIVSYINNVHPLKHRPLYKVIEQIIPKAIPLWNSSLSPCRHFDDKRIPFFEVEFLERSREEVQRNPAWDAPRQIKLPEPGKFTPPRPHWRGIANLREDYREQGLQVIVKLANIELTPEKPDYEGGSWHIEGQLNERICATAIYYYDSENITESRLAFRQRASELDDELDYPQDQHEFLHTVYGFGPEVDSRNETQITQDLGSVACNEGRLVTFPNTLQHRVAPFSLADRSKPGHRKILALFLIDPHLRIISSANVPPQQEEWARERHELVHKILSDRLPLELQQIVNKDIPTSTMTMEEAKEFRLRLMEERSTKQAEQNEVFETGEFSLCEH